MKKILLLGSQHGHELLGELLYTYIQKQRPDIDPYVTFKIGNIKAHRQKVRQTESDLNRSYNGKTATYEQRRANRILRYIKNEDFDLVLDLHTTTCDQPPCIIVPAITQDNKRYLRASSIEKTICMDRNLAAPSLIGVCPRAVSVEVNAEQTDLRQMRLLADDIARYISNTDSQTTKTVYTVNDLLRKGELSDQMVTELCNFQYNSAAGFYPILVGEASYKDYSDYLGFKAYKAYKNRL